MTLQKAPQKGSKKSPAAVLWKFLPTSSNPFTECLFLWSDFFILPSSSNQSCWADNHIKVLHAWNFLAQATSCLQSCSPITSIFHVRTVDVTHNGLVTLSKCSTIYSPKTPTLYSPQETMGTWLCC